MTASSPNGETDMNDIDIEEGRRGVHFLITLRAWADDFASRSTDVAHHLAEDLYRAADAIEAGRQWETIARRLADAVEALLEPDDGQPEGMDLHGNLVYAH